MPKVAFIHPVIAPTKCRCGAKLDDRAVLGERGCYCSMPCAHKFDQEHTPPKSVPQAA